MNWTSPVITVKVCINCVEPTDTLTNMFTLYIFPEIDHRLANLQEKLLSSTQYAKQKQSLKDELQDFLYALPSEKTLFTALPVDLCRFLIFKDAWVNLSFIPRLVPAGAFRLQLSETFAVTFGTVDSYIGRLRSIISDAGRQGEWNRALHLGSPAADMIW